MSPADTPRPLILIVDDEPSTLDILTGVLGEKYEVAPVMDGEQALEFCERRLPDLVLLDIAMPGVDGYEVCRRLKLDARTGDVPIIFVTAHNRPEDEVRGLEAGAVDFMAKPVHPAVVRARVGAHITLKLQADQLRDLALTDALTGVANRRSLEARLEIEWRRCRRDRVPLSVIMIDIDHFKLYNDAYGHRAGDNCLRHIAHALGTMLRRAGDMLSRYGGEEFVCLLPGTELEGAVERADEIGRAVERLKMFHGRSPAGTVVTISRGVGSTIPRAGSEITELLELADAMLYQAKHAGRNRTMARLLGDGGERRLEPAP
jgi:diguanylate cyclase (GGDEF)-like protein